MIEIVMKFGTTFMFIILKMIEKWRSYSFDNVGVHPCAREGWRWSSNFGNLVYFKFIAICFITEWNIHPSGRRSARKALILRILGLSPKDAFCYFSQHFFLVSLCWLARWASSSWACLFLFPLTLRIAKRICRPPFYFIWLFF